MQPTGDPPTLSRRLLRQVGRRGCTLLFLALVDFAYCFGLATPNAALTRVNPTYRYLGSVLPLWAWATMWGAVGLLCLIYAFKRHDTPAFAAAMLLKVLWGLMFLGGWLFVGLDRGYISTVVWLGFAAFIGVIATWPEPVRVATVDQEGRWTPPSP